MKKFTSRILVLSVAAAALASNASAALTAPTLSSTDFETVAVAVLGALATMWAIKKALGLIRV